MEAQSIIYMRWRALFKKRGIETILFYHGDHHPDEKMNLAFDKLFPIIDLEKQLSAFPKGVIYLNNYRSPKVVKDILKAPNLKFRFIHDHYLSCPRSSKTNPISNNTCTKKVGLSCYTCPGVISRHNKKFVFRTPKQTRAELKLHNEFDGVIVSSLYLHREMVRNGLRSKKYLSIQFTKNKMRAHLNQKLIRRVKTKNT